MTDESDQRPVFAILGATGGIGTALTHRLADTSARLTLAARSEEALNRLAEPIGASVAAFDATDPEAVDQWLNGVNSQYGQLNGVVNLVGSLLLKPVHSTSFEEWQETMQLNLTTAYGVTRTACKIMQKQRGGSIVLMSSVAACVGLASHEAIAAAKGGVSGLMLAAAASYANKGIRVNAVAPGLVRTQMTEKMLSSDSGAKVAEKMHPLGKVGEPDDIARVIQWLLDPATSWVTGQTISVDGGMSTVRPRVSG